MTQIMVKSMTFSLCKSFNVVLLNKNMSDVFLLFQMQQLIISKKINVHINYQDNEMVIHLCKLPATNDFTLVYLL